MNNWWNCEAKEVKRQPSAVTRPPKTAVSLVLFLRQNAIVTGETSRATPVDIAPSHPINRTNFLNRLFIRIVSIQFLVKIGDSWKNDGWTHEYCYANAHEYLEWTTRYSSPLSFITSFVKFSRKRKTTRTRIEYVLKKPTEETSFRTWNWILILPS